MTEQRRSKLLRLLIAAVVIVILLTAGLALDLTHHGLVWQTLWSLTGEESPLKQMRGMVEWLGNFTREQPNTDPDVPIQHVGVNPYGVNTFLEQEVDPAKREQQVQMIAAAGFHWVRQEIPWEDIEISGRGDFQDSRNAASIGVVDAWAKYDNIVDLVQKYGLELEVRIDKAPAWTHANPDPNLGGFVPPDNWDDYINFLTTFAQRYKGKIHDYQIWNEPNIYPEWGNNDVNAQAYTNVLCRAYKALKQVDPSNVVISAALAPTVSLAGQNLNEFIFLQQMYDDGVKGCFDVMSTQGYGFFSGPTDQRMRPTTLTFARNLDLRDVMVANGDADKPIWISEAGWNPVDAPDVPEMPNRDQFGSVTPDQAARYLPLAYQRAQQEWPWVGVINDWFFKRPSDADKNQPYYYFRMVEPDFTPLPIYDSMKQYIASTPPTLYAGVHQSNDWAIKADANAKPTGAEGAQFNDALIVSDVTFTYQGTGFSVRWLGLLSTKMQISVDGGAPITSYAPALQTLEIPATPQMWEDAQIGDSFAAETHTVHLSSTTPFMLDSVSVYDLSAQQRAPLIASLVAVGLVGLIGIGWAVWKRFWT
ncbi:MAG TPA: hypothetical protein VHD90_26565 [Phototrophicaceae bacterium]|nr:hypothetical protein [Phototrophicaceae bacterium]